MAFIAILGLIAGTLGAWLVLADLRDSKRRFEARLEPYGDVIAVPLEARNAPGGPNRAGGRPETDAPRRNATHREAK